MATTGDDYIRGFIDIELWNYYCSVLHVELVGIGEFFCIGINRVVIFSESRPTIEAYVISENPNGFPNIAKALFVVCKIKHDNTLWIIDIVSTDGLSLVLNIRRVRN